MLLGVFRFAMTILHGFMRNLALPQYSEFTKNGAILKVNNKIISHLTQAQCTPSAVTIIQVSHALPAVRFSCLLRGRGASFQDDVAAGIGFLCAPF
jgi:hypothetical protein